jgi:TPP-dependent pyruvate/acetoin dehydrogenase alpha subunit
VDGRVVPSDQNLIGRNDRHQLGAPGDMGGQRSAAGVMGIEELQALYERMLEIRNFELTASRLGREDRLIGNLHSSIGQEAAAVGVCAVLSDADQLVSTHRGHGHALAKGVSIERMFAELFGHVDGFCGGKYGTMHISDPEHGLLATTAIVGGGYGIAVGSALTAQLTHSGTVTVVFFGEGAVPQGTFHEALNLASLWNLPVVFVCENNQYAEMTHVSGHVAANHVADLAAPYEIPSSRVDGNDVEAVFEAANSSVEGARLGDGPALIECETYRLSGHYEGDPEKYRTSEELADWMSRDPITRCRERLAPHVAAEQLDGIETRAKETVSEACDRAASGTPVEVAAMLEHVYG